MSVIISRKIFAKTAHEPTIAANETTVTASHSPGARTRFSDFSAPCISLTTLTRFKYSAEVTDDSTNTTSTSTTVSNSPCGEYAANLYSMPIMLVTTAISP